MLKGPGGGKDGLDVAGADGAGVWGGGVVAGFPPVEGGVAEEGCTDLGGGHDCEAGEGVFVLEFGVGGRVGQVVSELEEGFFASLLLGIDSCGWSVGGSLVEVEANVSHVPFTYSSVRLGSFAGLSRVL